MTIKPPPINDGNTSSAWSIWFNDLRNAFNGLFTSATDGQVIVGTGDGLAGSPNLTFDGTTLDTPKALIGGASNNVTIDDDAGPVLHGTTTVWRDVVFPLIAKFTGTGNPSYTAFMGNIKAPQFAVNDAIDLDASEFIHEWLEASDIHIHIHWTSMTNVNATRGVQWQVEFTYVPTTMQGVWTSVQTFTADTVIPANTPAYTEMLTVIATVPIPNGKIGGQCRMRLKRIASGTTAPATDPFGTQLGIHLECNSMGSREIASK